LLKKAIEETVIALLQLDVDMDYIFILEKINYMFTKAHGASYLCDAIAMMFYKIKFSKEHLEIISQ
jgi:DNA polymerase III alpha subunit (gram-positive type)